MHKKMYAIFLKNISQLSNEYFEFVDSDDELMFCTRRVISKNSTMTRSGQDKMEPVVTE